ncbi:uncharacterized protein V6R79_004403 [Siganus canaliculatus]
MNELQINVCSVHTVALDRWFGLQRPASWNWTAAHTRSALDWGLSPGRLLFAHVKERSIYRPDKCTDCDKRAQSCSCAFSITITPPAAAAAEALDAPQVSHLGRGKRLFFRNVLAGEEQSAELHKHRLCFQEVSL